jgi:hypothetical protein
MIFGSERNPSSVLVALAYVSGYVWLSVRQRQQRAASSQI